MNITSAIPVHDLPGVGQIGHYLDGDENFLLDVDGTDHMMQESPRIGQKLHHLKLALQLMELLDLRMAQITIIPQLNQR